MSDSRSRTIEYDEKYSFGVEQGVTLEMKTVLRSSRDLAFCSFFRNYIPEKRLILPLGRLTILGKNDSYKKRAQA